MGSALDVRLGIKMSGLAGVSLEDLMDPCLSLALSPFLVHMDEGVLEKWCSLRYAGQSCILKEPEIP